MKKEVNGSQLEISANRETNACVSHLSSLGWADTSEAFPFHTHRGHSPLSSADLASSEHRPPHTHTLRVTHTAVCGSSLGLQGTSSLKVKREMWQFTATVSKLAEGVITSNHNLNSSCAVKCQPTREAGRRRVTGRPTADVSAGERTWSTAAPHQARRTAGVSAVIIRTWFWRTRSGTNVMIPWL